VKNVIPAVKGTRDFYPEQMAVRTWLYSTARSVAESFGYQEYEAPILESLALYVARSGDELVKDQAYVFQDRGGDQIALRPELTASLARMIAQRQGELAFPVRWWSYGPFWRYERPQRGRTREFFQWNVDVLGASSPEADAENVAVLATFLRRVGLTPHEVLVLVNDRRLMERSYDKLGIAAAVRSHLSGLLDRRTKMPDEAWKAAAAELGLSAAQLANLEALVGDDGLWETSEELRRFFAAIKALGLEDLVRFDASIVRGLQYYTGTVFEAWEVGGEIRRSLLGGGRYDNLLSDVGGGPLPAVGFALGDVVMTLLLEKYGLLPTDLRVFPAQILVTAFDVELQTASLQLASELRAAGLAVSLYPDADKLTRQFKYADRISARIAVVVGPDELRAGHVTLKDLAAGTQTRIPRAAVADACRRLLEGPAAQ
jgi:histidyl-tRNA synthetase